MRAYTAFLFACLLALTACSAPAPLPSPTATRPPNCAPLPPTPTAGPRPPTPTPNPANGSTTPNPITPAPLPTPAYIDLNPGLPFEDKLVARVFRCDGSWVEYLLDPAVYPGAVPLSPGDGIYAAFPPASLMNRHPPEP